MKRKKIVASLTRFGGACGIAMNGVYTRRGEGRAWRTVSADEAVVNANLPRRLVPSLFPTPAVSTSSAVPITVAR